MWSALDSQMMLRALDLARRGQGWVEPNPMVGCVILRDGQIVGEGWHQRFGGAHAEVEALQAAGSGTAGATLYVTLEPCCHHGKTPPCTEAVIQSGIQRVVAAMADPFPQVAGGGLRQLAEAAIAVDVGLHEADARNLNAPYLKLLATGRPWLIAKWAMTLDGKMAARGGDSKWISSEASRQIGHRLRSRVDAIVTGRGTAEIDDPLLTARTENTPPRVATRIVLDSRANLSSESQLVRTAHQYPTLVATGPDATEIDRRRLASAGCDVLTLGGATSQERLAQLLDELGRRRMTNILIEGGSQLLGAFFDARQIDEVHVFIAPKLFGGQNAVSPIAGTGVGTVAEALKLSRLVIEQLGEDIYLHSRIAS